MNRHAKQGAAALLATSVVVCACRERAANPSDTTVAAASAAGTTAAPAPSRLPPAMTGARKDTIVGPVVPAPVPSRVAPRAPSAGATSGAAPAPPATVPTATTNGSTATSVAPPAPARPSALAVALGRLPFRDGERLEYQVKYGFLGVGSATLQVLGLDSIRGTPTVHAQFTVQGGIKVYRVNDRYESWFDPRTFTTLRTIQHIDEGSYDRDRDFEMYPERQMMSENGKPDTATVPEPLDEASFLFFLRTVPLDVGQTYQFNRYFRADRNPVTVVVERKEQVKVPAGTFNTIVVRPVIKTSGIFGEGGRAEVWFTDDSTRTLVQLKSKLKFGSLNLYLRHRQIGSPWAEAAGAPTP